MELLSLFMKIKTWQLTIVFVYEFNTLSILNFNESKRSLCSVLQNEWVCFNIKEKYECKLTNFSCIHIDLTTTCL